jgi:hypothetical protein
MDTTTDTTQAAWPENVTARILTRLGMCARDFHDATVDIIDVSSPGTNGTTTALCRPCGWTRHHGLPYRDKALEMAREHAAECTALPQPTT